MGHHNLNAIGIFLAFLQMGHTPHAQMGATAHCVHIYEHYFATEKSFLHVTVEYKFS